MEPLDPQHIRISDGDRDKVAEVLREAAGEGRIDLSELDERLEATYRAKTYGDLVPITVDLPGRPDHTMGHPTRHPTGNTPVTRPGSAPDARRPGPPTTHGEHGASFAVMSETKRVGPWSIGSVHTATAMMGSVVLDLRQATFPPGGVLINANAVMGSVEVIVDAQTAVRVDGIGIMGSFSEARPKVAAEVGPDSPVVRVRGLALMGSVDVRRKGPPGELRRRLLGHGG